MTKRDHQRAEYEAEVASEIDQLRTALAAAKERAERAERQLADRNICEDCDRPLFRDEPDDCPLCPDCARELRKRARVNDPVGRALGTRPSRWVREAHHFSS